MGKFANFTQNLDPEMFRYCCWRLNERGKFGETGNESNDGVKSVRIKEKERSFLPSCECVNLEDRFDKCKCAKIILWM